MDGREKGEMKKSVVVVGSINADLVVRSREIPRAGETVLGWGFETIPGGKGANQAAAVGKLGYPVKMIGRVGSDAFAPMLRASLEQAGVDTAAVAESDGPSGVALIEVSEAGENSIVVAQGANAAVSVEDLRQHRGLIAEAGMVLAQLEIPLETVVELARICAEEKVPLMLDPAPARELPAELLAGVTWFTPNETEAAFFTGVAATARVAEQKAALFAKGISGLVLKQGSRGVAVAKATGYEAEVEAFKVKAVDTTAAGDAFNGAFAVGLLEGMNEAEAARFAAAAAAVSVTRKGAQPSMATRKDVAAMMGDASKV